ncbi:MAG: inner-rane translocator [Frankiales bacterium]|nr:inner-rane translocator [Frankiales bacterium]
MAHRNDTPQRMDPVSTLLALTVTGLVTGCIYALTASGLVVTYTTSGIFNFAHGAVGMLAAFGYWQLLEKGMPTLPAFLLTVLVLAPLLGIVIERVLIRRLGNATLEVTLTVTMGLLLLLLAIANTVWDATTPRVLQPFFVGKQVTVATVVLTYHQLLIIAAAITVPLALWAFLRMTRTGIAMRAVVDDRELAALAGASPTRIGQLGWGIGSSLAAVAGILLAAQVELNATTLTLLVINGYAAAVVGRLTSLPLTITGGLVLGVLQSLALGYVTISWLNQVQVIIPMLILFVALLIAPPTRLRVGQLAPLVAPRVPSSRRSLGSTGAFLVLAAGIVAIIPSGQLGNVTHGAAVAIILLSLVPMVGYGGMVSLCQLTFAGIGAVAMAKVGGGPLGLVAAVLAPAAVGALLALPTLRLRGLYLSLATLAFGYAMDNAFFQNASVMTNNLGLPVPRPLGLDNDRGYLLFVVAVFAACAFGVLAMRRSTLGRRLVALGDSPAGCATLGMGIHVTKLVVFALSAGLAGLGGALLGGQQSVVGQSDFALLLSLTLLLMAVVWGVRTISGVFIAALAFELIPQLNGHLGPVGDSVLSLLVGLGAVGLGRSQNGIVGAVLSSPGLRRLPSLPHPRSHSDDVSREEVLTGAQG